MVSKILTRSQFIIARESVLCKLLGAACLLWWHGQGTPQSFRPEILANGYGNLDVSNDHFGVTINFVRVYLGNYGMP